MSSNGASHSHQDEAEKSKCCGCEISKNCSALFRCSRCKRVLYCSRECQKKDWAAHKPSCDNLGNASSTLSTVSSIAAPAIPTTAIATAAADPAAAAQTEVQISHANNDSGSPLQAIEGHTIARFNDWRLISRDELAVASVHIADPRKVGHPAKNNPSNSGLILMDISLNLESSSSDSLGESTSFLENACEFKLVGARALRWDDSAIKSLGPAVMQAHMTLLERYGKDGKALVTTFVFALTTNDNLLKHVGVLPQVTAAKLAQQLAGKPFSMEAFLSRVTRRGADRLAIPCPGTFPRVSLSFEDGFHFGARTLEPFNHWVFGVMRLGMDDAKNASHVLILECELQTHEEEVPALYKLGGLRAYSVEPLDTAERRLLDMEACLAEDGEYDNNPTAAATAKYIREKQVEGMLKILWRASENPIQLSSRPNPTGHGPPQTIRVAKVAVLCYAVRPSSFVYVSIVDVVIPCSDDLNAMSTIPVVQFQQAAAQQFQILQMAFAKTFTNKRT